MRLMDRMGGRLSDAAGQSQHLCRIDSVDA